MSGERGVVQPSEHDKGAKDKLAAIVGDIATGISPPAAQLIPQIGLCCESLLVILAPRLLSTPVTIASRSLAKRGMYRFMARTWMTLIACVVAMLVLTMAVPTVAQDDGPEATIAALQTEVSSLQTQVASLTSPTPSSEPTGQVATSTLFGDIDSLVPAGQAGEVEVVLVGAPVRSSLPMAVRNNTGEDILLEGVLVTGRDAAGNLVAVSEVSSLAPYYLPAGGIAVGDAYFGTSDLPAGLTFEFEPQTKDAATELIFRQDLVVQEVSNSGSELIGIAVNQTDEELSGPFRVVGVCFDAAGTIQGYYGTYASKDALVPGEATTFSATFYGTGPCDTFAVGVTGYRGI